MLIHTPSFRTYQNKNPRLNFRLFKAVNEKYPKQCGQLQLILKLMKTQIILSILATPNDLTK